MSTPPSSVATDLAVDRTRLAHDRTLMAWIRTSASLISFGFTIYKFFDYMVEKGEARGSRFFSARKFALCLIAIGLAALVLATIQNRRDMKVMRERYGHVPYSLATLVAGMVGLLGVIAFAAVMFRQ